MHADRTSLSIRWRLVVLFATVMLIAPYPTYGQNGAVGVALPAKGITVDGDLSDWPEGLQTYPIERIEYGDKLGGKDDLNAHFRIAYNAGERALYVAVEVRDDSLVLDGPGEPRGTPRMAVTSTLMRPTQGAVLPSFSMLGGATRPGFLARLTAPTRK